MEARVCFQPNTIMQFGDVIGQYQAWHQYMTEKHQVEFVELEYSKTQASQCLVLLGYQVVSTLFFSYMGMTVKCNIICNYVVSEIPSANIGI